MRLSLIVTSLALCSLIVSAQAEARERPVVGKVVSGVAGLPVRKPFPPRFTIRYEPCPTAPDALGCADVETGDVFVQTHDRFARWHELGHVFDHQVLSEADRWWFAAVLGFPVGTPWSLDEAAYDSEGVSPSEQFADAYASCALGRSPAGRRVGGRLVVQWATGYDYYPTAPQHERICAAITRLAS